MKRTPDNNSAFSTEYAAEDTDQQKLMAKLPSFAKLFIEDKPEDANFRKNPDDPNEHDPEWHQFGIITHTERFCRIFQTEARQHLKKWGLDKQIKQKLAEQIDGKTKMELLKICIPLHDLGKFKRGFIEKNGVVKADFTGHEANSENFIKTDKKVNDFLKKTCDLTDDQIDYIARCAGLHYELGKSRNAAKETELGYTLAFAESDECRNVCRKIAADNPEFQEEIGVLFLCDSLAKTDIRIKAETDDEISAQIPKIEKVIRRQDLNPKLISGIKQLPINVAIARTYLENI